ncbi:MAG: BamA/TamA family outer membrane protein [Candidatus Edwardsbacteria bacterium]|nr:BamA/TamA family outer membrane protein [Candidatus Edwardsbacteria bacterium]
MNRNLLHILLLSLALLFGACGKKAVDKMAEPVDEGGPRLKLGEVTFIGNTAFSGKELRSKMTSESGKRFDDYTFQLDMRKVLYMYRKKGYLDAKFLGRESRVNIEKQQIDYQLTIEEGNIRKIGQLRFSGNQVLSDSLLLSLLKVKTGDPLNLPAINQTSSGIVALYAERGYIYTAVNDTVMESEDPYTSDILFNITEGPQVRLGEIRIEGNKKVRDRVIEREFTLKPGEIFMPSKVYYNQQRVYALGLFTEAKFEMDGMEEKRDTVDLRLVVKEDKTNWVGYNIGFESSGNLLPDRVQGGLEWGSDNIFGNLQKITIKSEASYGLQKNDETGMHDYANNYFLDYLEPYFLSTSYKASGSVYYKRERQESSFWQQLSRIGGETKVGKSLAKSLQVYIGYKYEFLEETQNTTSDVFLTASFDSRDDMFNPQKGVSSSFRVDNAGSVLGGSNDYRKSAGDFSMFHSLGGGIIMAWRVRTAGIYTYGRNGPVPIQERLKLGGAMNLRGYKTDEITTDTTGITNMLVNGNFELRIPIYWMFGAAVFVDAGNVWAGFGDVRWRQFQGGTGLGLRFITPVGPVRVDYAVKTEETIDFKEGLFYINLGHAF